MHYRRAYRVTREKETVCVSGGRHCAEVRRTLHDSRLLSILVHFPSPSPRRDLSPFELAARTSARVPGISRPDETGIGAHVRVHARIRAEHATRLSGSRFRRNAAAHPRNFWPRSSPTRSDSLGDLVSCAGGCIKRLFLRGVSSLLGTNAIFYVDISQLGQPFVIFNASFGPASEIEATFERTKWHRLHRHRYRRSSRKLMFHQTNDPTCLSAVRKLICHR